MIDFTTLQGLTIPEGVVTQITDESGRVLWSAVKEVGTFYLRPSADISVEHDLSPSDSTSAYLLINEEVCDSNATKIFAKAQINTTVTKTSVFAMSINGGEVPKITKVLGAKVCGASTNTASDGDTLATSYVVNIDGNDILVDVNLSMPNESFAYGVSEINSEAVVNAINNYISANGVGSFPTIKIALTSTLTANPADTKSTIFFHYISQAYIELTCEYVA